MKDTINEKKLEIILAVLLLFCAFFVMKINGIFDYSSKYGITTIDSDKQSRDTMLMIDGDAKTAWGMLDPEHKKDDKVLFTFKNVREISGIRLMNNTVEEDYNFEIVVSEDGKHFQQCAYEFKKQDDKWNEYRFHEKQKAVCMILIKSDDKIYWPISEVEIYD